MTQLSDAVFTARRLVAEEFGQARAAWLGGSVAAGNVTPGSDLDITVLLPGPPAPFRDSREYEQWPVELFVHTETSLEHYRSKDRDRRQPTIMRLVGESVVLVNVDGSAFRLQEDCAAEVLAGPEALSPDELASRRYAVTDLLTDLESSSSPEESAVIASSLWLQAADLLLTGSRHWTGGGKWLHRELQWYDGRHGSSYAAVLVDGLRASTTGDVVPLRTTCDDILDRFGGRLFAGHRLGGEDPRR